MNVLPFTVEARDQWEAGSVGNFSGQVVLVLVSSVPVFLTLLVIIILHCSIFIQLSIMGAISSKYRVIHNFLRDFRTRLRNNQDRHGRKEHINR